TVGDGLPMPRTPDRSWTSGWDRAGPGFAAAARQILVQLYPSQKSMIDRAYAASVKAIPDGAAKSEGVALGEQVAAAVLADRSADGTDVADTYRPFTRPGVWVPTTPPSFEEYARAKPWVLKSADQF